MGRMPELVCHSWLLVHTSLYVHTGQTPPAVTAAWLATCVPLDMRTQCSSGASCLPLARTSMVWWRMPPCLRFHVFSQAADFLFGSAQPHDPQFEQLFRIFAAGNLGAASAALAIKVQHM